jgi:phytoene dehydrogenase-like protein
MARGVRIASRLDMPAAFDKLTVTDRFRILGTFAGALPLVRDLKRPVGALVASIASPALREAFGALFGDAIDLFPLAALYMMLGFMAKGSAGYPKGGSRAFAKALEAKYLSLGGTIEYRSRVDEILVEDGKAVGVRGAGGETRADYVVSAADAYDTLKRLLGGRYAMPMLDPSFEGRPGATGLKPYPSLVFVGMGLGAPFAELPHSLNLPLPSPLVLEGGALRAERLTLRTFNFDPSFAPAGKVAATVMLETRNFDYWNGLAERDPEAYAAEKRRTGEAVVAALGSAVPGFADAVEVVDVATPKTFARYTNNWLGSYEGWLPVVGAFGKRIPRKVPGVDRLRLVGQWVNPGGGLPPCAIDGRNLAKELCRLEGQKFRPD